MLTHRPSCSNKEPASGVRRTPSAKPGSGCPTAGDPHYPRHRWRRRRCTSCVACWGFVSPDPRSKRTALDALQLPSLSVW
eukprot:1205683-Prymnesium_polylepis.3